jgi:hypothetical protein
MSETNYAEPTSYATPSPLAELAGTGIATGDCPIGGRQQNSFAIHGSPFPFVDEMSSINLKRDVIPIGQS